METATPAPAATPSPAPAPTSAPSAGSAPTNTTTTPTRAAANAPANTDSKLGAPDAAPALAGETPAEKKARILKAKIGGQEREFNVDELTDEELTYRLQMSEAARQKMSEAAQIKKQFEEIRAAIKADPFSVLKDPAFGVDLEALAEQRLAQKYKESTMPEHERKALEAERKAEQYKKQVEQYQKAEQFRKQAEEDARVEAELKKEFKSALEFASLPVNDTTMYMLADEADIAERDGIQLSSKQLAARVKERMSGLNKHVFTGLKGENLAKYLGDDVVKEVLRYAVDKFKKPGAAATPAPASPVRAADLDEDPKPRKRKSWDEITDKWRD
jgi:hypothetical protein